MSEAIWRDIPGYNGDYRISDNGEVFSTKSNRMMSKHSCGRSEKYKMVELWRDNKRKFLRVHRLVMLAFIGLPDKNEQVDHLNGIHDDNRLCNLEYVTQRENSVRHRNMTSDLRCSRLGSTAVFRSVISKKNKSIHLIRSKSRELCSDVYNAAVCSIENSSFDEFMSDLSEYRTSPEKVLHEKGLQEGIGMC